jgi:hypothetical protein
MKERCVENFDFVEKAKIFHSHEECMALSVGLSSNVTFSEHL